MTQVSDQILISDEPEATEQDEKAPIDILQKHTPATAEKMKQIFPTQIQKKKIHRREDRDPMGHSVLDNMEISMVHVLSVDFQPTASQPNSLDGDVVAEEATQV